ncbi:hypothetical protein EIP86_007977 [Pleurotus ostreatoroseus]|nr:hypothetical protein EIP86_007977 [Pleurotus ostreatoroseus]
MSEVHPSTSAGSAADDDWEGGLAYYTEVDATPGGSAEAEDLRPPNKAALYSQPNRSVPNVSQQQRQQSLLPDGQPPIPTGPPPPYDATAMLDSFGALHISDPVPRGGSAMGMRPNVVMEQVQRPGTSMSMRPMQARMPPPGQGPPGGYVRSPQGPPDPRFNDAASIRSARSGNSYYYSAAGSHAGHDSDRSSTYSHDGANHSYGPPDPRRYPPQQGWQGQQQPYMPGPPPPNRVEYNPLYAAASDVLGMGPPPGVAPAPPPPQPMAYATSPPPQQMRPHPAASSAVSLASSQSSQYGPNGPYPPQAAPGPYPPQGPQGPPPPGPYPPQNSQGLPSGPYPQAAPGPYPPQGPPGAFPPQAVPGRYPPNGSGQGASLMRGASVSSTGSGSSGNTQYSPMPPPIPEESEIEFRRPQVQRSPSGHLKTRKTKAVDLTAPPYTKEYVDEYRQRIKDDPDPEAHFLYAKYLIEAARKFGTDAKDQRAVKKYRDSLIVESLKVVRRLATQGQAYDEAQFFLANCHGTGMLGLQVDHERAYHLYLQAAKQNHAAACYRVGVCNEIGAGTKREPQRAAAFYRKAASLGDTAAMYKLGVVLLRGNLGEQPNAREAVGWLRRAAEQADIENPHALHELAMLYENPAPTGGVVPLDPNYARELYTRAGLLGYTHSQFRLGQCYEYGNLGCAVDPKRSIAWYTKAAEKGHSEAELALSGWYLTGSDGVLKQSDSEAYLWARRAANKGLSKAEYAVGYYAEVGIGVKQDVEFAKRWYMRAAVMDDSLDHSLLEVLDSPQVNCLNEDGEHTLKNILASKSLNTSSSYLLSDVDEQLLLNISFNQIVRIRSIVLKSTVSDQQPRLIKLFINRPTLGFSDVEDAKEPDAAQIIELTEEQVTQGKRIPLRYVRFQSVNSLHIFVATNAGDEQTRIDAVDVFGVPAGGARDLSNLRNQQE